VSSINFQQNKKKDSSRLYSEDRAVKMSFSDKLKNLRKMREISQEELAKNLHVTKSAVWKYEQDKAVPSADVVKELAVYFGVTTDYLIFEEGEKIDMTIFSDKKLAELFEEICRQEPRKKKAIMQTIEMMLGK
jgi:transcriptional regulator with XRE-family HTH domain